MSWRLGAGIGAVLFPSLIVAQESHDLLRKIGDGVETDKLEILQEIQWLLDHPYEINEVNRSELQQLPGITPEQVAAILDYRTRITRFRSISQLEEVPGLTNEAIETIRPFLYVRAAALRPEREQSLEIRIRHQRSLPKREGFIDGSYDGSPDRLYTRVNADFSDDVAAGILAEKDPGEISANAFLSGYCSIRNVGALSEVILGDFRVRSGQGLTLWNGSGSGKGGDPVLSPRRRHKGISPSRSGDEVNFLRGVAAEIDLPVPDGDFLLTGFFSHRLLAGSIGTTGQSISIDQTGLFRTDAEVQKRDQIKEVLIGGLMRYRNGGLSVGAAGYQAKYTPGRAQDQPGRTSVRLGLDTELNTGVLVLFGEISSDIGSQPGFLCGTGLDLSGSEKILLMFRSYPGDGMMFRINAFGEGDDGNNEEGLYLGVRLKPSPGVSVSGFVDFFSLPYGTEALPLSISGNEISSEIRARFSGRTIASLLYAREEKETVLFDVDNFGRETRGIGVRTRQKLRLTAEQHVGEHVRLKGRIERTEVRYSGETQSETGMMIYQDVRVVTGFGLKLEGRMTFYQTDSYDSRIYQFESDVRGLFSIPPLFGRGRKWYFLVQYEHGRAVRLSIKYSNNRKEGVKTIGTGANQITGDTECGITAQIDVSL